MRCFLLLDSLCFLARACLSQAESMVERFTST
nr:MAG TPA: hypothetical protein [Caudoviricetes sp.]